MNPLLILLTTVLAEAAPVPPVRVRTRLLDTRTRRLAAIHDQRIAAAQLELAAGTLNADSEALR